MRSRLGTVLLLALFVGSAAPALGETAQQQKMQSCNTEASAKELSGDARKKFMSECLKKDSGNAQQQRMRACNAQAKAKSLSGDARKQFMQSCLSGQ
jgi:hypothetical protein